MQYISAILSLVSLVVAIVALTWQFHLDRGKVHVSLNSAIIDQYGAMAVNESGSFGFDMDSEVAHGLPKKVLKGTALEVAQLVIENPGRTPVTIYSPGLSVKGVRSKNYQMTPRTIQENNGRNTPCFALDLTLRLEPYERTTLLFDYWNQILKLIKEAKGNSISIRGCVRVAGHPKKLYRSSHRKKWVLHRGDYSSLKGDEKYTHLAALWRLIYGGLPESLRLPEDSIDVSRCHLNLILETALGRFDKCPSDIEIGNAVATIAKEFGYNDLSSSRLRDKVVESWHMIHHMKDYLTPWGEPNEKDPT
ncbi:hypothetical protein PRAC110570_09210 [Propionibacterium acidifaciens]